jgi:hypothetical protein
VIDALAGYSPFGRRGANDSNGVVVMMIVEWPDDRRGAPVTRRQVCAELQFVH